ncbi:NADPH-dependent FMN reductase [Liberiplasma polymorphum]|uniref:NADPH-dependent FMN reductase n=1 Tax=Liberiplasma polymorphum TaxID=3374570 RepID=UPI0037756539
MSNELLNIGIILGSTRTGRVSPQVGKWVLELASKNKDANYEIIDIKSFNLPFLGTEGQSENVSKFNKKIESLDGFIFVVCEYNHSISGALKNALDSVRDGWINKAAGIVSYGSAGGARAAEHLRGICAELQIADVRTHIVLSTFNDFDDGKFQPLDVHSKNVDVLLNQVNAWSKALKPLRK